MSYLRICRFPCGYCETTFTKRNQLQLHLYEAHDIIEMHPTKNVDGGCNKQLHPTLPRDTLPGHKSN